VTARSLTLARGHAAWQRAFEEEAARIRAALGDVVLELHHIGSTSVAGLPAKPIVDILLGLERLELTDHELEAMASLGYEDRGEAGVPLRRYFARTGFHVHGFRPGEGQWDTHLLLRRYLTDVRAARRRYRAFKLGAARRSGWDRRLYQAAKDRFVDDLLDEARSWDAPVKKT
jgi:GrpB-like predicted nucleotidyltransferase (UPF0157 family)